MTTDLYLTLVRREDAPAVAAGLADALNALGFQPYDPFPGGTAPSVLWKETVRAFVEPARGGWTRVLGQVRPEALERASAALGAPALHLWLARGFWGYLFFVEGEDAVDVEALAGLLRPGRSLDDVRQALGGEIDPAQLAPMSGAGDPAVLPEDVQHLAEARGVNMDKAQRMIEQWTNKLFSKLDKQSGGAASAMRAQAGDALAATPSLWDTSSGQRLRAFAACLALPAGWHHPALDDVRQAYIVARRKAQRPGASLLPGDEAALARVPDAAGYIPLYFGMTDR